MMKKTGEELKMKLKNILVTSVAFACFSNVFAAEVTPGTMISKGNIDAIGEDTFEGRKIKDLIAPTYADLVKNSGFTIRLGASKPYDLDPRMIALTKEYSPKVKLTAEGKVDGYEAGMPFPNISLDDSQAGRKLAYNIVYSGFLGDVLDWPSILFVMVSEDKGYLRKIDYKFALYQMIGRKNPPRVEGDGTIRSYTTLIATQPTDVRGVGIFSIRYADGRLDDNYAYLRTVRRFRRIAGSSWYDPVQGSDFLGDETSNGFNGDPGWYKSYRILSKQTMLFPESEQTQYVNPKGKGIAEELPYVNISESPYWNTKDPKEVWRPREVYVLEAIPPDGYPASRRVLYVDANPYVPIVYFAEGYDKKGMLWRIYTNSVNRAKAEDGAPTLNPIFARMIDVKTRTATLLPGGGGRRVNPKGVTAADFSIEAVRKIIE
jgi:hypothetical protein